MQPKLSDEILAVLEKKSFSENWISLNTNNDYLPYGQGLLAIQNDFLQCKRSLLIDRNFLQNLERFKWVQIMAPNVTRMDMGRAKLDYTNGPGAVRGRRDGAPRHLTISRSTESSHHLTRGS